MKFLTPNQLSKISHKKATIVASQGTVNLLVRDADEIQVGLKVYTVWNYQDGFTFCTTGDLNEAVATYNKYAV